MGAFICKINSRVTGRTSCFAEIEVHTSFNRTPRAHGQFDQCLLSFLPIDDLLKSFLANTYLGMLQEQEQDYPYLLARQRL